jgi:hypothetical protein
LLIASRRIAPLPASTLSSFRLPPRGEDVTGSGDGIRNDRIAPPDPPPPELPHGNPFELLPIPPSATMPIPVKTLLVRVIVPFAAINRAPPPPPPPPPAHETALVDLPPPPPDPPQAAGDRRSDEGPLPTGRLRRGCRADTAARTERDGAVGRRVRETERAVAASKSSGPA